MYCIGRGIGSIRSLLLDRLITLTATIAIITTDIPMGFVRKGLVKLTTYTKAADMR